MERRLFAGARIAVLSMAFLVAGGAVANAFVLLSPADKDAIGNRNDIFAQATKFTSCIVKAAQTCEKGTDPITQQCAFTGATTGTLTAYTGGSATAGPKFEAAIAKCIAKVDYAKKGAKGATSADKYAALGCPGDCGGGACSDLGTYQASALSAALTQVNLLSSLLPGAALQADPSDTAGCVPPSSADPKVFAKEAKAFDKCVANVVNVVAKYAAALQKCAAGCEADYKNKKGNGGDNDGPPTCNSAAISDPSDPFAVCVAKATDKATKKPLPANIAGSVSIVGVLLDQATNSLFNSPGNCM